MALAIGLGVLAAGCGDEKESAAPAPNPSTGNLSMEITSVTIPQGDNVRPVVRFRVIDTRTGQPVNLAQEVPAGDANPKGFPNTVPRFTLAQRDDRNDYHSYYVATVSPKPYVTPAGAETPPAAPATQAQYEPPSSAAWPVGDLKDAGGGFYEYTMPSVSTAGFDRTKPHTVASWTVRTYDALTSDVATAAFHFVPNGGAAAPFEAVSNAACNNCHGFVQAHGSRRDVQLCITCHNPGTTDPETSRTVDFKVLIHKIHSGATLPSVEQGKGYFIVGYRQNVADFSDIVFPYHNHGVQHCTVCHSGGAQSGNWATQPTQAVCTSCHDNVHFTADAGLDPCPIGTKAGTTFADCVHAGGPITVTDAHDVNTCKACHGAGASAAIDKFHHGS
jgi:OmcA/MtrC family decaheme c-type cytochrome